MDPFVSFSLGDESEDLSLPDNMTSSTDYSITPRVHVSASENNLATFPGRGVEWCEGCRSLRQELEQVKAEHLVNYKMLKEKIIPTDMLIKRYNGKAQEHDVQTKKLEEVSKKLERFQRDCDMMTAQLKATLEEVEPLKKVKDRLEKRKEQQKQHIQELQDKLQASEITQTQLMTVQQSRQQELEKMEKDRTADKQKVKDLEASLKKMEAVNKRLQGDYQSKRAELSAQRKLNSKVTQKSERMVRRLAICEDVLKRRGLFPEVKRHVGWRSATSSEVSHNLSEDWDTGAFQQSISTKVATASSGSSDDLAEAEVEVDAAAEAGEDAEVAMDAEAGEEADVAMDAEAGEEAELNKIFLEMGEIGDSLLAPLSPAVSPLPLSPRLSQVQELDEVAPDVDDCMSETSTEDSSSSSDECVDDLADQLENRLLHPSPDSASQVSSPRKSSLRSASPARSPENCSSDRASPARSLVKHSPRTASPAMSPATCSTNKASPARSLVMCSPMMVSPATRAVKCSPRTDSPARSSLEDSPRKASPAKSSLEDSPRKASPARSSLEDSPRKASPARSSLKQSPRKASPARNSLKLSPRKASPLRRSLEHIWGGKLRVRGCGYVRGGPRTRGGWSSPRRPIQRQQSVDMEENMLSRRHSFTRLGRRGSDATPTDRPPARLDASLDAAEDPLASQSDPDPQTTQLSQSDATCETTAAQPSMEKISESTKREAAASVSGETTSAKTEPDPSTCVVVKDSDSSQDAIGTCRTVALFHPKCEPFGSGKAEPPSGGERPVLYTFPQKVKQCSVQLAKIDALRPRTRSIVFSPEVPGRMVVKHDHRKARTISESGACCGRECGAMRRVTRSMGASTDSSDDMPTPGRRRTRTHSQVLTKAACVTESEGETPQNISAQNKCSTLANLNSHSESDAVNTPSPHHLPAVLLNGGPIVEKSISETGKSERDVKPFKFINFVKSSHPVVEVTDERSSEAVHRSSMGSPGSEAKNNNDGSVQGKKSFRETVRNVFFDKRVEPWGLPIRMSQLRKDLRKMSVNSPRRSPRSLSAAQADGEHEAGAGRLDGDAMVTGGDAPSVPFLPKQMSSGFEVTLDLGEPQEILPKRGSLSLNMTVDASGKPHDDSPGQDPFLTGPMLDPSGLELRSPHRQDPSLTETMPDPSGLELRSPDRQNPSLTETMPDPSGLELRSPDRQHPSLTETMSDPSGLALRSLHRSAGHLEDLPKQGSTGFDVDGTEAGSDGEPDAEKQLWEDGNTGANDAGDRADAEVNFLVGSAGEESSRDTEDENNLSSAVDILGKKQGRFLAKLEMTSTLVPAVSASCSPISVLKNAEKSEMSDGLESEQESDLEVALPFTEASCEGAPQLEASENASDALELLTTVTTAERSSVKAKDEDIIHDFRSPSPAPYFHDIEDLPPPLSPMSDYSFHEDEENSVQELDQGSPEDEGTIQHQANQFNPSKPKRNLPFHQGVVLPRNSQDNPDGNVVLPQGAKIRKSRVSSTALPQGQPRPRSRSSSLDRNVASMKTSEKTRGGKSKTKKPLPWQPENAGGNGSNEDYVKLGKRKAPHPKWIDMDNPPFKVSVPSKVVPKVTPQARGEMFVALDREVQFLIRLPSVCADDIAVRISKLGVTAPDVIEAIVKVLEDKARDVLPLYMEWIKDGTKMGLSAAPWCDAHELRLVELLLAICRQSGYESTVDRFQSDVVGRLQRSTSSIIAMKFQMSMCRCLVALCRQRGALERVRVFAYDLLRYKFPSVASLVLSVAVAWPLALSKRSDTAASVSIQVMEYMVMQMPNQRPVQLQIGECLRALLGWEACSDPAQIVKDILTRIKQHTISNSGVAAGVFECEAAVELLALNQGWQFANGTVLIRLIWPQVQVWVTQMSDTTPALVQYIASLVRLLGGITYHCPKAHRSIAESTMKTLASLVQGPQSTMVPVPVQLAALQALMHLAPFNSQIAASATKIWLMSTGGATYEQELKPSFESFLRFYRDKVPMLRDVKLS